MHEFIARTERIKVSDEVAKEYGVLLEEHNKAANMKSMLKIMPELMYTKANATAAACDKAHAACDAVLAEG